MKITDLQAIEILDSRGNPTVEVVLFSNEKCAKGSAPSGASTGSMEAFEFRDGASRFNGKGVLGAVHNCNTVIKNSILNKNFESIEEFDTVLINLDETHNKSNLGANSILACSVAFTKLLASIQNKKVFELFESEMSMPCPMMNIINGGVHADNNLNIQEFMIMPVCGNSFAEALRCGVEIYHTLKKIMIRNKLSCNTGDEGGFAPMISDHKQALELILQAIEQSGYRAEKDVLLAIDVAASELLDDNNYNLFHNQPSLKKSETVKFYQDLIKKYPIFSIEDAMAENDDVGFQDITEAIGNKVQLVGDDVFTTNPKTLESKSNQNICNAVLIKPNQIGTISETINFTKLAQTKNYATVTSHRSGETNDATISHLAVGLNTKQIKAGAPARGERVEKYNELLRIESANNLKYSGEYVLERYKKFKL